MSKTGWNRKLGTSKREQGIVTPSKNRVINFSGFLTLQELLQRSFENLPERIKQHVIYRQLSKEKQQEAREKFGYKPY